MAVNWTQAQKQAIEISGCNVLAAAAAGSGKTAVLVERIIQKITDETHPTDIDSLLVTTFTEAAAAKMRQEITDAIYHKLEERPKDRNLQRQLTLAAHADICTIHSFCLHVVRSCFHLLDIDPDFSIGDTNELALMKEGVLDDLFDQLYEAEDKAFFRLLDTYASQRGDQPLRAIVLKLYDFVRSMPDYPGWLARAAAMYESDGPDGSVWLDFIRAHTASVLTGCVAELSDALKMAAGIDALESYEKALHVEIDMIKALIVTVKTAPYAEIALAMRAVSFQPARAKRGTPAEIKDLVIKPRDRAKKLIARMQADYFGVELARQRQDFAVAAEIVRGLCHVTLAFDRAFFAAKQERNVLDFNDIEHLCLSALGQKDADGSYRPSAAAVSLRDKYTEIFIDEYQDANEMQEAIFSLISRGDNVFMVGDMKQSIYRFRHTNPLIFQEKRLRYSESSSDGCLVSMQQNFRSRGQILDTVNFIFRQVMSPMVGEIAYDDTEQLNLGAVYPPAEGKLVGGDVEVYLLGAYENVQAEPNTAAENATLSGDNGVHKAKAADDMAARAVSNGAATDNAYTADRTRAGAGRPASRSGEKALQRQDADGMAESETEPQELAGAQAEAQCIADRICQLMRAGFCVLDRTGRYRPITYRDIVILMRSPKRDAAVFSEILTKNGIPVFADVGESYFISEEVMVMKNLLSVIDNPDQDIALLSVLRSPVFGFDDNMLLRLRLAAPKASIYGALRTCAAQAQDAPAGKGAEAPLTDDAAMQPRDGIPQGDGIPQDLAKRCRSVMDQLSKWRGWAVYMPAHRLLQELFDDTLYYAYAGAQQDGQLRQANLDLLYERARSFENTSFMGLYHFISYIDRIQRASYDAPSARLLGENQNVVRIMSIHKSKGLEFGVVFVARLAKRFNMRELSDHVLMHPAFGIGLDYIDSRLRYFYPMLSKSAIREKMRYEQLSEEMRLLYVALTRAKEKLILTAAPPRLELRLQAWADAASHAEGGRIAEHTCAAASSFADWLMPALLRERHCAQAAGLPGAALCDELPVSLHIGTQLTGDQTYAAPAAAAEDDEDTAYDAFVHERLDYAYDSTANKIPAKLSVTELKRILNNELDLTCDSLYERPLHRVPQFLSSEALSGAARGSVMHYVMQRLDLSGKLDYTGIKQQVDAMKRQGLLTKQQAAAVKSRQLAAFFASELGRRLVAAEQAVRETPFEIAIPAKLVQKGAHDADTILLQGIIDCYFFDTSGEIILLDYKTDSVHNNSKDLAILKKRYEPQLTYYALALEKMTGCRVAEAYLYFFSAAMAVHCEL